MKLALCNFIEKNCKDKKILILGMGREGLSTYKILREVLPNQTLNIGDKKIDNAKDQLGKTNDKNLIFYSGQEADFNINSFDLIFKTPGIPTSEFSLDDLKNQDTILSQTSVFLELFRDKVIGITGTKGKSTTTTLIYKMLSNAGKKVVLAGNIGIPFFSIFDDLENDIDFFVCEFSSHQLEFTSASSKYALLLNIYEEHLDHYKSYRHYQSAKLNIFAHQCAGDSAIYFCDNPILANRLSEVQKGQNFYPYTLEAKNANFDSGCFIQDNQIFFKSGNKIEPELEIAKVKNLKGNHNIQNMMAVTILGKILRIPSKTVQDTIIDFERLPHRMEPVGEVQGIHFFNDSISTIPEAAMYSIDTIGNMGSLIMGGLDRGIHYDRLIDFLIKAPIDNIILIDAVGQKIYDALLPQNIKAKLFLVESLEQAVELAFQHTTKGKNCLLAPAAASYGMFKNFEERGDKFKEFVLKHAPKHNA